MTIDELKDIENLSVRTYNVCCDNNLNSLNEIIVFYKSFGSFKSLRNCGVKSNDELLAVCEKYESQFSLDPHKLKEDDNDLVEVLSDIRSNPFLKNRLLVDAKDLHSELSVRSKNALAGLMTTNNFDVFSFFRETVESKFDFKTLRNVGYKSVKELNMFRQDIVMLIRQISDLKIDEFDNLILKLERQFGSQLKDRENLKIVLKQKRLNLLHFFEQHVLNSSIVNFKEREIYVSLVNIKPDEKPSQKNKLVGESIGITGERVRQISKKLKSKAKKRFAFLKDLYPYSFDLADNLKANYWEIKEQPTPQDSESKDIHISLHSFSNLLTLLANEDFFTLTPQIELKGNAAPYDSGTYKKFRRLRSHYTVQSKFISKEKTLKIIEDVYAMIIDRIDKDMVVDFSHYELNREQFYFVQQLISKNFELELAESGVVVRRNTLVTLEELVEQILIEFDLPMSAEQVYKEFLRRNPDRNNPLESVRSILSKDRFIYIRGGDGSIYGLKEWEKTKELKAGSIKSICSEYLRKSQLPVHIYELGQYVRQYRETEDENLLANLKLDTKNRYRFYRGGFIGHNANIYPMNFIKSLKTPSGRDANNLCLFVKEHGYYNYHSLVNRFSSQRGLKPIQIEYIIHNKSREGILRTKDNKVYYNRNSEDRIVRELFYDNDCRIRGIDPYRVEFEEKRIVVQIIKTIKGKFILNKQDFRFDKYHIDHSDHCAIVYFSEYNKNLCVLLWESGKTKSINFNIEIDLNGLEAVYNDVVNEYISRSFIPLGEARSFISAFKTYLNPIAIKDLDIFDIRGLKKLDAYSHIMDKMEEHKGRAIGLIEAKKIFNQLKLRNQS